MHALRGPVLLIGLGAMGAPMASRLRTVADALLVSDVDPRRAAEVAAEVGARHVSAAEGAVEADVVILMLPDSSIVQAVLFDDGVLAAMKPGALLLDMSSSRPERTVAVAAAAREAGVRFVDAPVSGGVARARTGELTVMAGGAAQDVDAARWVLDAVGTSIVRVGDAGAGHAAKALNNLLSAVGLMAACEVVAAGERFGIEPTTMLDVLNSSTGRNQATQVKLPRHVFTRTFDSGFSIDLLLKDLDTALTLVETGGSESIMPAIVDAWRRGRAELGADGPRDHTEIARWVERRYDVVLEG